MQNAATVLDVLREKPTASTRIVAGEPGEPKGSAGFERGTPEKGLPGGTSPVSYLDRRPRAQGTSAGPDEAAGQQTRPLPPVRRAPRIPRRA
jgi:hypothetical protein